MKYLVAFIIAIFISVILIAGICIFNSHMQKQVEIWMHSHFALGIIPRFLINLSLFFRENIFLIVPFIVIANIVIAFIFVLKRK